MTISSENTFLCAYAEITTGNLVTAIYQSQGGATNGIRSDLKESRSIYWTDQRERLLALNPGWDNMTRQERRTARAEYIKHRFKVVTFRLVRDD